MTTEKTSTEMPLHTFEVIQIKDPSGVNVGISATRIKVPGGWIYGIGQDQAIFVPEPFELLPASIDYFTPEPIDL